MSLPSLVQTIQDVSASLVQPHSPTTQATIAIIVTLGLLGCVASVFVGPKTEHEAESLWARELSEMPSPTAHAESNQGGKVTLGGGVHAADSFSSVVVTGGDNS